MASSGLVGDLQARPGLLHDRLEIYAALDEGHDAVFLRENELRRNLAEARMMLSRVRTPSPDFDHCTVSAFRTHPAAIHPLCAEVLATMSVLEVQLNELGLVRDRFHAERAQNWRQEWGLVEVALAGTPHSVLIDRGRRACRVEVHVRNQGAIEARALVTFVTEGRQEDVVQARPISVSLLEYVPFSAPHVMGPASPGS